MNWLEKPEFAQVRAHFFARFLMDYHNRSDESFQICNSQSCELSEKGFEKFRETFKVKGSENA
jgi:hypothetical protein